MALLVQLYEEITVYGTYRPRGGNKKEKKKKKAELKIKIKIKNKNKIKNKK